MSTRRRLLVCLLPVVSLLMYATGQHAAVAQDALPDLAAPTSSIRFEHITVADGLADDRISGLLHDSEGYMWFGSQDGLTRFDGYEYTTFFNDPSDSLSLSSNYIEVLYETQDNTMWVGTWGGGVNRFDRSSGTFERYRRDRADTTSLAHDNVAAIAEDAEGNLWFGTSNGLSRFDSATRTFVTYRHDPDDEFSLSHDIVRSLLLDQSGMLWVGTGSQWESATHEGGLNRYDPATDSFIRYPGSTAGLVGHHVVALFEDHKGILWVGTASGGPHRMDPDLGVFEPVAPALREQGYLTFMFEDRAGRFWVGTETGVNLVDRTSGHITKFGANPSDEEGLAEARVWRMYEDRTGTLWMACGQPGCLEKVRTEPKAFRSYGNGVGESGGRDWNRVFGFTLLRDGALLISTDGGLFVLGSGRDQIRPYEPRSEELEAAVMTVAGRNDFLSLYEDQRGMLWFGGVGHLSSFDPSTRQMRDYSSDIADSLSYRFVADFAETDNGDLLVAGGHGVFQFDRAEERFRRLDPNAPNWILSILPTEDGTMWIGTWSSFSRYDPNSNSLTEFARVRLANDIYRDADGVIWVASDGGLVRMEPETGMSRTYTREDGLPTNAITKIVAPARGQLWLATRAGISRFDPAAETFHNYDARDGLESIVISDAVVAPGGGLFFAGNNGIEEYVGGRIGRNNVVPDVRITSLSANGNPIVLDQTSGGKPIRLSHRENDLSLSFVALHYQNPSRNTYRIKLDPIDESWTEPGPARRARYPNLDPGLYTFHVKAANADGIWNEEGASVTIRIAPPWWRTIWAYLLFGSLLAASIFATNRFQRRRLIARERDRTRERELEQAREIERAYVDLREAKDRLVQQEKMASLGELTAGIAHEIKNPLNFVNNFAVVNEELAGELRDALDAGNTDEARELVSDLERNSTHIVTHGKRADGIVHSMMQHASGGSGQRELTDLNVLVSDHIDLAYHGKLAQIPDLDVEIIRDLDPDAGRVNLIAIEFGRVLLNLVGNSLDAIHEAVSSGNGTVTPTVIVETRRLDHAVEIRISDNGPGIPVALRSKIFEPFFTTKPTGMSTGLGLSLSYDIVTQGHGGTLEVESEVGQGATFVVMLPVDGSPERG